MKRKMTALLLAGVFLLIGGLTGFAASIPQKDNPNLRTLVYGNSDFAVAMYKKVGAAD